MKWTIPSVAIGCLVGYLAGYGISPDGRVSAQRSGNPAPARVPNPWQIVPLNPNQPDKAQQWTVDKLTQVHTELAARIAKGQPIGPMRDLIPLLTTRTHAYSMIHRPASDKPSASESHDGVTDVYFVTGGSATMWVGGTMPDKAVVPGTLGEYRGQHNADGQVFKVKAGDIINVPPGVPHSSQADPGGETYMLLKINVGLFPWEQVIVP